jgi:hypothetical protein
MRMLLQLVIAQVLPPVRDGGRMVDLSIFSSCGQDAMLLPP